MAEPNYFERLPLEIRQEIGLLIEDDKDITNYSKTCRATHEAVESDSSWFWQARFLRTYNNPQWNPISTRGRIRGQEKTAREMNNYRFKRQYVLRYKIITNSVRVDLKGPSPTQKVQLDLMTELIQQSCSPNARGDQCLGLNFRHIEALAQATRLDRPFVNHRSLEGGFEGSWRILRLQCSLGPAILRRLPAPERLSNTVPLAWRSQQVDNIEETLSEVFLTYDVERLFHGFDDRHVDVRSVVYHLNFWKEMLTRDNLYLSSVHYYQLPEHKLPRWWDLQLITDKRPPGTRWLGVAAYANEDAFQPDGIWLESIGFHPEETAGWTFEELHVEYVAESEMEWDDDWEIVLECHSRPRRWLERNIYPAPNEKEDGRGPWVTDADTPIPFKCSTAGNYPSGDERLGMGWIASMPYRARDGPFCKRFNLVMYTPGHHRIPLRFYEGVILPGSQIIVGHWWIPPIDEQTGRATNTAAFEQVRTYPFIFWAF